MNVCVVGWYFTEDLMDLLAQTHSDHPTLMVCHKIPPPVRFPTVTVANRGLEFGAYDHYLKCHWDEESPVLFMHDDAHVTVNALDKIADMVSNVDQAFIFRDEEQEKRNWAMSHGVGAHGRGFVCSPAFLLRIRDTECNCQEATGYRDLRNPDSLVPGVGPHQGFFHDPGNNGHIWGPQPRGVRDYNSAILHFVQQCSEAKRAGMNTLHGLYVSGFDSAKRGKWDG